MSKNFGAIGKYQVLATLGQGANSVILHVRRLADSKQYALKVVTITGAEDRKFQAQVEHEFRVAQLLDHPNLVRIHALETVRNWLFRPRKLHLLIEYVNGQTLDTLPRLSVAKLVRIFVMVSEAVMHMHRRNIFHADLKPNNILLARNGDLKVIDYGLAWIKGEDKGRIQGTPQYIAPEQAKHSVVNERTDIYNLGATMYRLVTLRLPPSALAEGTGLPLSGKLLTQLLKPIEDCNPEAPPELCDLIRRCMHHNPANRPASMGEVKETLEDLAHKLGCASVEDLAEID